MKYKIAICDDESIELTLLSQYVKQWAKQSNVLAVIDTFPSSEAFLFHYAEHKDYDILMLDVEMGKLNGIDLAKQIRKDNTFIQIIFITGFSEFISEGYEVSALHYLIKPVKAEKLFSVLDRACIYLNKTEPVVLFKIDGENIRVKQNEILYIEAFAHSVTVYTMTTSFEVKRSITEIETLFDTSCIRCHRSYIVNLYHAKRITKTNIILDNEQSVPLSRNKYTAVNQAYIQFYKEISDETI